MECIFNPDMATTEVMNRYIVLKHFRDNAAKQRQWVISAASQHGMPAFDEERTRLVRRDPLGVSLPDYYTMRHLGING
jgi:hypothetical protein